MSAKQWGNCKGGLNCPADSPPAKRGLRHQFKRGWQRLQRRLRKRRLREQD